MVTLDQPDPTVRRGFRTVTIIGLPKETKMQETTCTVCGESIVLDEQDGVWENSHGSILCQGENQPHSPFLENVR